MLKKLTTIGNSLGLVIERPILELLQINRETMLEISTDGEALIIRPARDSHRERVDEAAERLMGVHEETMRKLAR